MAIIGVATLTKSRHLITCWQRLVGQILFTNVNMGACLPTSTGSKRSSYHADHSVDHWWSYGKNVGHLCPFIIHLFIIAEHELSTCRDYEHREYGEWVSCRDTSIQGSSHRLNSLHQLWLQSEFSWYTCKGSISRHRQLQSSNLARQTPAEVFPPSPLSCSNIKIVCTHQASVNEELNPFFCQSQE